MTDVYLSSPTNSTMFTTCCRVAILDHQERCPSCLQDVYPFSRGMTARERDEESKTVGRSRWSRAYGGYR